MLASQKGYLNAHSNVGLMYKSGLGVEQSFTEAAKYFNMAAEQNDPIGISPTRSCSCVFPRSLAFYIIFSFFLLTFLKVSFLIFIRIT